MTQTRKITQIPEAISLYQFCQRPLGLPLLSRFSSTWKPRTHLVLWRDSCASETRYFPGCSTSTRQNQHLPEWSPGCCWASWKSSCWHLQPGHAAVISLAWDLKKRILVGEFTSIQMLIQLLAWPVTQTLYALIFSSGKLVGLKK